MDVTSGHISYDSVASSPPLFRSMPIVVREDYFPPPQTAKPTSSLNADSYQTSTVLQSQISNLIGTFDSLALSSNPSVTVTSISTISTTVSIQSPNPTIITSSKKCFLPPVPLFAPSVPRIRSNHGKVAVNVRSPSPDVFFPHSDIIFRANRIRNDFHIGFFDVSIPAEDTVLRFMCYDHGQFPWGRCKFGGARAALCRRLHISGSCGVRNTCLPTHL